MGEEEIREELCKADSLMKLIQAGSNLKKNGADERLVNKVLSEVRRSLVSRVADIKKIPRREFPQVSSTEISHLTFQVKELNSPKIIMEGGVLYI